MFSTLEMKEEWLCVVVVADLVMEAWVAFWAIPPCYVDTLVDQAYCRMSRTEKPRCPQNRLFVGIAVHCPSFNRTESILRTFN